MNPNAIATPPPPRRATAEPRLKAGLAVFRIEAQEDRDAARGSQNSISLWVGTDPVLNTARRIARVTIW